MLGYKNLSVRGKEVVYAFIVLILIISASETGEENSQSVIVTC